MKVDLVANDKTKSLCDLPSANRANLSDVLKMCVSLLCLMDKPFNLSNESKSIKTTYETLFKKFSTLLPCLNRLRDKDSVEVTTDYFVQRYLSFDLCSSGEKSSSAVKGIDIIEFVRPVMAETAKTKNLSADKIQELYRQELVKRNKQHWSNQLSQICYGYL